MEFEVLKRGHIKRNIIIGAVVVIILAALILTREQNIEQQQIYL